MMLGFLVEDSGPLVPFRIDPQVDITLLQFAEIQHLLTVNLIIDTIH
jgi:hypothetical protein